MKDKYAIVYSSITGNTEMLAQTIRDMLPKENCVYYGKPGDDVPQADIIFAGFWCDKGTCDETMQVFLKKLRDRKVFLFATVGHGLDPDYAYHVLSRAADENLDPTNTLIGRFGCQGKMQERSRQGYYRRFSAPEDKEKLEMKLKNFEMALSHPDENDLDNLKNRIKEII